MSQKDTLQGQRMSETIHLKKNMRQKSANKGSGFKRKSERKSY